MDSSDVRNILQTYANQINEALDKLRDDVAWSITNDDLFTGTSKEEVIQVYTEWTKQEIKKVMEELTNGKRS